MSNQLSFGNFTDFSDLDSNAKLHVTTALVSSLVSFFAAIPVVFFYFLHPQYKTQLRSHFNNLIVGSVLLQGVQSLQRAVTCIVLLSEAMNENLCEVASIADTFFDMSSVVLIFAFYYSLLSLRFNPIKSFLLRFVDPALYVSVRRFAWFGVAFAVGVAMSAVAATYATRFGYLLGWCTPMGNRGLYFGLHFLPLMILVVTSIATMISLRCCTNREMGITQTLTWERHWSIYVRFFSIIVFVFLSFLCTSVTHLVLKSDERSTDSAITSAFVPLWPFFLSMTFLLTEGIFHQKCVCLERPRHVVAAKQTAENSLATLAEVDEEDGRRNSLQRSSVASRSSAEPLSTRSSLYIPTDNSTLIGFTIAIQSLLVMEVQGVQYIVTNTNLIDEQNQLLGATSPARGHTGYDGVAAWSEVSSYGGSPPYGATPVALKRQMMSLGSPAVAGPMKFVSDLSDRPDVV